MEKETKKKNATTSNKKKTTVSKSTNKTTSKKTATKSAVKKNTESKRNQESKEKNNEKMTTKKIVETKKENKKEITKVEPKNVSEEKKSSFKTFISSEMGSLTILVLIIAAIILLFLLITNIINSKIKPEDDLITSNDIQYDEILVSNILKQSNSNYYVLVYDEADRYFESYNLYLSGYNSKDDSVRFYTARLNIGFNKSYYAENESNVVGASIEELKFKGTTLIKVENGNIVSAYEEPSTIIEHFKSIIG